MGQVTRTVRVTRTWNVEVAAEFGDTEASLKAKVAEKYLDDTPPDAESRVLVLTPEQQEAHEKQVAAEDAERAARIKTAKEKI